MKKLLAFFLTTTLLLLTVSCGMKSNDGQIPGEGDPTTDNKHPNDQTDMNGGMNEDKPNDTTPEQNGENNAPLTYQNAHELLAGIWSRHGEDERFPIMGGDYDNVVENAPGAFDITHPDAGANIDSLYSFPSEELEQISSAAGMVHGMNANIFTCGAFQVKEGQDPAACAERIKNHILTKQFICGSPEQLTILSLPGNYLISVYGTADAVASFVQKATSSIADTAVIAQQELVR